MENVKEIVKIGQKLTTHKGECIGTKIYEMKKEVEVSKVNKKSFIASGIKFSLWKVTDKDNGQSMESGEIYQQLSGFDSPDDMQLAADCLAYALCHVR